jgi:hypothetical protein
MNIKTIQHPYNMVTISNFYSSPYYENGDGWFMAVGFTTLLRTAGPKVPS